MTRRKRRGGWGLAIAAIGVALAFCAAPTASAREVSLDLVAHDVSFNGESREQGMNVEAEFVGDRVEALKRLGAPRPYAMVSANTHGDTSYAAAGLYWHVRLSKSWSLRPGFGVAVHDGALHNKYPPDDPRASAFARSHALLGTRALFRDTLALERRIDDRKTIGIVYEHLSNGGSLFGHRDNEGLNEIGVRFSFALS